MVANPYPTCGPASSSTRCPSAAQLTSLFPTPDAAGAAWSTQVKDNGTTSTQSYFSDTSAAAQPAYDANGDGKLWVRAQATAQGRTRTLVALVRAQQQEEDLPHAGLLTGRLDISNNGNKTIIDASAGGLVAVRCAPMVGETMPCAGHIVGGGLLKTVSDLLGSLTKQITGTVTTGYTGGPAMSADAQARLKARAVADGTYFTACPAPEQLSAPLVYIESGACSYTGNTRFNSPSSPGMLFLGSGSVTFGGTTEYDGVVYAANQANSTGTLIQIQGNASVRGGVLVDGNANTVAGSAKMNIVLDPGAFQAVQSYGSAGVIQNTWKELKP
jgi:hypothetical protein